MADSTDVLTALSDELETLDLIRRPNTAGDAPPLFIEPSGAAPAPGDRDAPENDATLCVTARLSTTLGEQQFDSFRRRFILDVMYRSKTTRGLKRARELDTAILEAIVHRDDYGLGWTMGTAPDAVFVLSSQLFAGLGPVSADPGGGRTELAKYLLEVAA